MVAHIIPCTGTALDPSCGGPAWAGPAEAVGNAPATHESEPLKTHAGIADTVAFAGLGHKFQIWEPGRFRAELAEATEKVRALKRELGSRVAERPQGARE